MAPAAPAPTTTTRSCSRNVLSVIDDDSARRTERRRSSHERLFAGIGVRVEEDDYAVIVLVEQRAGDQRALARTDAGDRINMNLHCVVLSSGQISTLGSARGRVQIYGTHFMDIPHRYVLWDDRFMEEPSAAVVWANHYQFHGSEVIRNRRVGSVCVLWVRRGVGDVTVDGRRFAVGAGSIVLMPWMHEAIYRADAVKPFEIGTVHLVPAHAHAQVVEARVAHLPGDPLLDADFREGGALPRHPVLLHRSTPAEDALVGIAEYAVSRFAGPAPDEAVMRALGRLLLDEARSWASTPPPFPAALRAMMEYITRRLDAHPRLEEISDVGGCSSATAERLFRKHTGMSVQSWARAQRMAEAAHLLRSSSLRVREVALRVGFDDPLHFSRAFKAVHGEAPSRFSSPALRP